MSAPNLVTPERLLDAYASGIFPMATSREDDDVLWVDPDYRGILPLDRFHISRSLRKTILREAYQVKINTDFPAVLAGCANREDTWINRQIWDLYLGLFDLGHAHCVEVWDDQELIGGLYGVSLGAAFFGESMFSRRKDASKIAMAYLVARMRFGGFTLLDTQFLTPHLASLGGIEITREQYHNLLRGALRGEANFLLQPRIVFASQVCN